VKKLMLVQAIRDSKAAVAVGVCDLFILVALQSDGISFPHAKTILAWAKKDKDNAAKRDHGTDRHRRR
jgi:hypothetical protein